MNLRFRLVALGAALIGSFLVAACSSAPAQDEDVESAAWGYRGRPTNMFLSEHGLGSRDESLAYYDALLAGSSSTTNTFTLAQWKAQFIGSSAVHTALYRNKMELGFWREMTCTQLIGRGTGGCTVTNWSSPTEPSSGGGAVPNKGTVAMNVSTEGFVRFYVFLPDGKLSPSAVLDSEGPKFLPRLCTVCHSGSNLEPGQRADLGSVFREFEPALLEHRPGISRTTAEQEWFRLNRVVQQANLSIRSEADGSPSGTNHARTAIHDRIDALYIPGGQPDAVPASWAAAGPEAKTLWTKLLVPYCLACHRHNAYDWTDYSSFSFLRDPNVIKNYLPNAPDPNAPVGSMPQAQLSFQLLSSDQGAKSALSSWLNETTSTTTSPAPGSTCSTLNQIFTRSCGACGQQQAVCLDSGASNNLAVSQYGVCSNEVVNGCIAGTVETSVPCGQCGTLTRTCANSCTWSTGACVGQPANACTPGDVDVTSAGCAATDQYRQRTCGASCGWGTFSATCSPLQAAALVAPANVGATNTTIIELRASQTTNRMPSYGTCPLGATAQISTTTTPYAYTEVRNPTTKSITVSIYNSQATGGPIVDTVMVAYKGNAVPSSDAERRACFGNVGDFGTTTLTGDSDFASLDGVKAITIGPNASVQIYTASYYAFNATSPNESTGKIKLNVRTDAIVP